MLKTKIFNFFAEKHDDLGNGNTLFLEERTQHEKLISDFIESLSKNGHTFISIDSVSYGRWEYNNRVRTIIVYLENPSRKVIFEKAKKDD